MDIKDRVLKMRRDGDHFDPVPNLDKRITSAEGSFILELWDRVTPINGVSAEIVLSRPDVPDVGYIYLVKDSSGKVIIFQPHLPGAEGYIPMSEEQALEHGGNHRDEMIAQMIFSQILADEEPVLDELEQAKKEKIEEIQRASDHFFGKLQKGYTLGEISSFERQKSGARDILAGKLETEDAVYVASLAAVRQAGGDAKTDAAVLAGKIMKNAIAAEQAIVAILGHQQGLEVKAREAKTPEELETIVW